MLGQLSCGQRAGLKVSNLSPNPSTGSIFQFHVSVTVTVSAAVSESGLGAFFCHVSEIVQDPGSRFSYLSAAVSAHLGPMFAFAYS